MRTELGSFSGPDWAGPATWAQRARWDMIQRHDTTGWYRNAVAVWPVPGGAGMADVLARIERAVSRFEGLRTQVVAGPNGPVQRTFGTGEYPVEIVEAGRRYDDVVAEVGGRLRAIDLFDPNRLPFRFAVVTEGGVPRGLVICVSHLAMDASTIRLLLDDDFMTATSPPTHPRDLVARQQEAAYLRRSERSVVFWRGELSTVDLPFTERLAAPTNGTVACGLTSTAAAARLDELSERLGLSSSAVVLGMVAVGLESVGRHGTLCLQQKTSNRHLPGLAGYFGVLVQLTPLVVEVDPALSFWDLVRRVQERSMKSFRNAFWSPAQLYAGLRADGLTPDGVLGATYTFNDVRGPSPRILPREPDPGRDYALHDLAGWPFQLGRCAIAVAGGPAALSIAARVDTAYLPAETVPRMLIAMDSVLRQANADPDRPVADLIDAADPVHQPST